jgi:signal transduction histidine kinase
MVLGVWLFHFGFPCRCADIAVDAKRGRASGSSTRRTIFASASRPISGQHRLIRLADDTGAGRDYGDAMHLRLGDKRQRDWLVAGILAAASLLQLSLGPGAVHQQVLGSLLATAVCATVAFRQRYPAAAGVAAQGISALDFSTWHDLQAGGWTIAWFCSLYGLAVWSSKWRFAAGAAFVGLTDLLPVGRDADPGNWSSTAIGFAIGTMVVMLLVRRIVGDRDNRARLAERERDVAAREAVVEERARIARELHDAVAHSVSMMVIQAGAERRVLGPDHASTREVLQTIEQIGRSALTEMRRLVGMLRTDSSDRLAPQPKLADLPTLVTQVREAGLPVELHVNGECRELPVGIELSAYRIVQEALTNTLKHAGQVQAAVRVRYGSDSLELEITDDGGGIPADVPGGGHGLAGIRERVTLYGGTFDASAQRGGGFAVRVLLPLN